MLSAGHPFPNFSLPNQDGKTIKLSDFAGQWLVIYFYPKDDTPGCTIQGKSFTATKADFDAAGVKVIGVSADDVASHKNFCNTSIRRTIRRAALSRANRLPRRRLISTLPGLR